MKNSGRRIFTDKRAMSSIPIDEQVRQLTAERLQADVAHYLRLLERPASEEVVHDFLATHSYFFNGILRLYGASPLYSKIRLGSEFVTDFVWFDSGSVGPEWYLTEIESPGKKLFTSSGDPTADLTHAIRQVSDWQDWIHRNLSYAQKTMPHIIYPMGYVFMGRRDALDNETRKRLRKINYDSRKSLQVHTLDWFAEAALSVLNLLKNSGSGHWQVPMRALTHQDLSMGLPSWSIEYMENFMRRLGHQFPDIMLEDRGIPSNLE